MQQILLRYRGWMRIHRAENLPLAVELAAAESGFNQWLGAWRADFEGQARTAAEMACTLEDPDRRRREAAWRAAMAAHRRDRDRLDGDYDALVALRHRLAVNAGFASYGDYRFEQFGRFDYTPQDCLGFHAAVAAAAGPLARRVGAWRERSLGLAPGSLRPWDEELDGLAAEAPLRRPDAPGLEAGVAEMLGRACPPTAAHFQRLRDQGTLDLLDRPGKRLAGFFQTLDRRRGGFIYMTANGTPMDVATLVHEAGHAMHSLQARAGQRYCFQTYFGFECGEGVAMAMELLALRHLGVFYAPQEAAVVAVRHLLKIPHFLGYACAIDAFQLRAYAQPQASHAQRDAWAAEIHAALVPGLGWEHFPAERGTFWQRKQHVFNSALYYIEYAIAQLFALQVWRRSRRDPAGAVAGLVAAMGLGGTVGIPGFFQAAGVQFRLDAPFIAELMRDLEGAINEGLAALGQAPLTLQPGPERR
jgi:oligoendopeptidase F